MHEVRKKPIGQSSSLFLLAGAVVILSYTTTFVTQPFTGSWGILGIAYLVICAVILGNKFFRDMKFFQAFSLGLVLEIGWLTIASGAALLFASLTPTVIFFVLVVPVFFLRAHLFDFDTCIPTPFHLASQRPFSHYLLLLGSLALLMILFIFIASGWHEMSSVSPWQHLPPVIFTLYFTSCALALTLAMYFRRLAWYYFAPLLVLSFGILPVVYPLGFGFDPFIHKATEQLVAQFGHIEPRPYFYSGYYGFVTVIHFLSGLSLDAVDTFLLIALLTVMLPAIIFMSFRLVLRERYLALLAIPLFLLIPYGDLIQSTPQSASLVFSLISIVLVFLQSRWPLLPGWSLLIAPITALFLHPLTGIPVLLFVLYILALKRTGGNSAKSITTIYLALSLLALPCAFALAGSFSTDLSVSLGFDPSILKHALQLSVYRFSSIYDLVYSIGNMMVYSLVLFSLIGYWTAPSELKNGLKLLYVGSIATLIAALTVLIVLRFNFATPSEQIIFGQRLFRLAIYFLFPSIVLGITEIVKRARKKGSVAVLTILLLICALLTVSWYMAYPRFDTREQSKGYSPSAADRAAVQFINRDGAGTRYVVLANQTVSAVALREFGFLAYYADGFYYPLPTSGSLYGEFLRMVDEKTDGTNISTALKERLNVERVYFVLNSYWSDADKLAARHNNTASGSWSFGNGQVTVFRY
ncbi:MAG: hypothetical protein AAB490_02250 [Patescibacteria group bacterium]